MRKTRAYILTYKLQVRMHIHTLEHALIYINTYTKYIHTYEYIHTLHENNAVALHSCIMLI